MSNFTTAEIVCPCGARLTVRVVLDLFAATRPADRAAILAGTFQEHRCGACARVSVVESRFVYTDFTRHHYVVVEPSDVPDTRAQIDLHRRVFRACFDDGPPIARDLGAGLKRRLVIGLDALREKLRLWDAELDDYVVEAIKADVLARARRDGVPAASAHLIDVLPGGHLILGLYRGARPGVPPAPARDDPERISDLTIPAATYRQYAAARPWIARQHPDLADEWLVDARA
jgi:hypothetical protein